jgi:repressor LexA
MKPKLEGWDSLHPTQQKLYELLAENEAADEPLTLQKMGEELGVGSLNTVVHHLKQLERKGYIRRDTAGRIETLARPLRDIVYLNLYGLAGCGPDGFINEDRVEERIPFPAKQLRISPNAFLVRAKNDSMEPMIHSDDLVVIEPGEVLNGDVALVVQKDEAKLKRYFRLGEEVILQSLNPKYSPSISSLEDEDVRPVGVVRGVVHNFTSTDLNIQKSCP